MFFVSAIRTYSRGWPRSSSTHEPSDPPLRMESLLDSSYIRIVQLKLSLNEGGRPSSHLVYPEPITDLSLSLFREDASIRSAAPRYKPSAIVISIRSLRRTLRQRLFEPV
jgi:hypothetical protein